MIASKLQQAKDAVENVIQFGKGQAWFEWQSRMLVQQSDHDAAVELGIWWASHPSNPNKIL